MSDRLEQFRKNLRSLPRPEGALPAPRQWDEDLIPAVDPPPTRSPEEDELRNTIRRTIPILEAYKRYIGKAIEKPRGDETQVSCPVPGHVDEHPSACVNTVKNTGCCYACNVGFDVYDLRAWRDNLPVPGYKHSAAMFGPLSQALADDWGIHVHKDVSGTPRVVPIGPPEPVDDDEDDGDGELIDLFDDMEPRLTTPGIDWRSILEERSTFLRPWIAEQIDQPFPEEFAFWTGLLALGFALGNTTLMVDNPPVRANFLVCFVSESGARKSQAILPLTKLLRLAFPYRPPEGGGVLHLGMPGSGEALLDAFAQPLYDDPADPKKITGYAPVKGLVKFDELSSFVNRAARSGNDLKAQIMNLFDFNEPISTSSRTHGKAHAENHFCQVISTTQPGSVGDLLTLSDNKSGFLNRWVFVPGRPKPRQVWTQPFTDFDVHVNNLKDVWRWAMKYPEIKVDPAAQAMFSDWVLAELDQYDRDKDIFRRVELLMKKLMLALAADAKRAVVREETVEQAIQLWPYLRDAYGFVADNATVPMEKRDRVDAQERVLMAAKRFKEISGKDPSERDLQQRVTYEWYKHHREDFARALELLIKTRELEPWDDVKLKPDGTRARGRATTRYRVAE